MELTGNCVEMESARSTCTGHRNDQHVCHFTLSDHLIHHNIHVNAKYYWTCNNCTHTQIEFVRTIRQYVPHATTTKLNQWVNNTVFKYGCGCAQCILGIHHVFGFLRTHTHISSELTGCRFSRKTGECRRANIFVARRRWRQLQR